MSAASKPLAMQKRYELITRVLRNNIATGRLPAGFVLLEGPIARLLKSSRAPVQTALRVLDEEGLVHRFSGRGYLVGPEGAALEPIRGNIANLGLQISEEIDDALQTRGTWQHFYDQVEEQVAACVIFGQFWIVETELGDYLGVSRTVVRDILGRLHERGLISKNQSSHWTAGPLTANAVREKFVLRAILEPEALRMARKHIAHLRIEDLLARLSAGEVIDPEILEDELFHCCIARAPNTELVQIIHKTRFMVVAANRALTVLGLPHDQIALDEYRTLFDLIARHRIDTAADYLRGHLRLMGRKSLARLKIVAVIGSPLAIAPYLKEVTNDY